MWTIQAHHSHSCAGAQQSVFCRTRFIIAHPEIIQSFLVFIPELAPLTVLIFHVATKMKL